MSEEFATYGLDGSIMIGVGISKVILALLLLLGAVKFPKYIKPAAAGMALFMLGAVYFHLSIGDGIIPTLPAAILLLCCLTLVFDPKFINKQKS
jgi:hypothetical protein